MRLHTAAFIATVTSAGLFNGPLFADPVALDYATPPQSDAIHLDDVALWVAPNPSQSLLIVADSGAHSLEIHNPVTNTFVGRLGSLGNGPGMLHGPTALAVAQDLAFANGITAVLFVVEHGNGRVSMYSLPDRTFRGTLGSGLLRKPASIGLWNDGDRLQAWVSSTGSSPDGVDAFEIAANGSTLVGQFLRHFDVPALVGSITVDQALERALISDLGLGEILVYDLAGTPLQRFGAGRFVAEPGGMVIYETGPGDGYLIVADRAGSEFEVFDRTDYRWIGSFSGPTNVPSGVTLTRRPLPGLSGGALFTVHASRQVHCYQWPDIGHAMALQIAVQASPPPAAALALGSPNGGESWAAGASHDITWSSQSYQGAVRIEYSDAGGAWILVAEAAPNTGSYAWTTDVSPTASARIRLSDPLDGLPSDTSNNDFRVLGPIARLVRVSGDGQTAPAGTLLPAPFVVRAEDVVGNVLAGIGVDFTVVTGAGGLSTSIDSTDASGTASTRLRLGTTPGLNRVEASVAALSGAPVTFTSTGLPPQLLRGPYLQQVTSSSALVVWKMTAAVACSLDFGIGSFAQTVITPADTQQVVALDGLEPGSRYDYRVRCGTLQIGGSDYSVRTAPLPDSTVTYRLLAWGDSGTGDAAQMAVAAVLNTQTADLALHVGDIIYNSGEASRYNPRYFTPYAPLIRHVPVWAVLGNHDAITESAFLDAWYLPANPIDGTERYYSFDYGDLHCVALDTNLPLDTTILGWLEADLQGASRRWKIVFFHHTMYSCGSYHGSSATLISKLGPVFDRQAVDLVVYGHDHHYERSFPMRANQPVGAWMEPDYRSPGGTIYIVTGGGAGPRPVNQGCEHTAVALPISHFTRFDFVGTRLTIEAIDTSGQVVDRMTLDKGLPPPPRPQYELTVSVSPVGSGSVELEPPGGIYDEDTVVRVTAGAASGWMFTGWSGDLTGSADPESITMQSNHTVVANFVERTTGAQVVLQEVTAGGSAHSTVVSTTAPLQAIVDELYLAAVSTRLNVAVDSVAGLGMTWTRVRSQCAARNRTGMSVWSAQGTPAGTGSVTAYLASAPDNAAIVVTRYAGLDTLTPILTVLSGNPNGVNGTCSNGTDTNSYSFESANVIGDGLVYWAVGMRDRIHTPGLGASENLEFHYGSSSFGAGIAVCDEPIAASAATPINGTFSETADWAVVALLLAPRSSMSQSDSPLRGTEPPGPWPGLRAWPLPYRGGELQIAGSPGPRVNRTFAIHNASGRLVRRLTSVATPNVGWRSTWDGTDASGRPVAAGIYFLTADVAGAEPLKVVVIR